MRSNRVMRLAFVLLPGLVGGGILIWSVAQVDDLSESPIVAQVLRVSNRVSANEGNAHSRMSAWRAGMNMFSHNPILGVGPLNFRLISKEYWETPDFHEGSAEAHNTVVKVLAETGVIGGALFLLLVANQVINGARRSSSTSRQLVFLGYLAVLSMALTLSLSFDKYFWLVFALAGQLGDEDEVPVPSRDADHVCFDPADGGMSIEHA